MNGTEISKAEALMLLERIIGMPVTVSVWYGGVLNLEFGDTKDTLITMPGGKTYMAPKGEYSVSIEGNWVLSNSEGQLFGSEYIDFKDAEKYNNFIGQTKILGIDVVENMKVFTFALDEGKEVIVTGTTSESNGYFYLSSKDKAEDGLFLDSNFKFKKIPRN